MRAAVAVRDTSGVGAAASQAELKHFHFQTKFLWPFVAIVTASPAPPSDVREFVVHVVTNVVMARSRNIRSGWKSILAVYAVIASTDDASLVSLAFDTLNGLLKVRSRLTASPVLHYPLVPSLLCICLPLLSPSVRNSLFCDRSPLPAPLCVGAQEDVVFQLLAPFFVDVVHCLQSFAGNRQDRIAVAAVDHLSALGRHLALGHVPVDDNSQLLPASLWHDTSSSTSSSPVCDGGGASDGCASDEPFEFLTEYWYNLLGPENDDIRLADSDASGSGSGRARAGSAVGTGVGSASGTSSGALAHSLSLLARVESRGNVSAGAGAPRSGHHTAGWIKRFTDCHAHFTPWWPLLTGLATVVGDPRPAVRIRCTCH